MNKLRPRTSPIWKIPKEDLIELVKNSKTIGEVLAYFKLANRGASYTTLYERLKIEGIDHSKFKNNYGKGGFTQSIPLEDILKENSTYSGKALKKRLIKCGKLENKCILCGLLPIWNNKPLVLVLDHINGIYNDHRLNNLRLLCPNCHSQTDTFAGRNTKRHKTVYTCMDCGSKRSRQAKRCKLCDSKLKSQTTTRKIIRPSIDQLVQDIKTLGYRSTGKKYGVSDNAIRKWLKPSLVV